MKDMAIGVLKKIGKYSKKIRKITKSPKKKQGGISKHLYHAHTLLAAGFKQG